MIRSVLDVRDAVVGLLEQHRKTLVRARNEGLEKAASRCEESDAPIPISEMAAGGRRTGAAVAGRLAKEIRALKESEQ